MKMHRVNPPWSRELVNELSRAVEHAAGDFTITDLLFVATTGGAQIWQLEHEGQWLGAVVTQIAEYPRQRVLRILALAGKGIAPYVKEMLDVLLQFGAQNRAYQIEANARPSMERLMRRYGFYSTYAVMRFGGQS